MSTEITSNSYIDTEKIAFNIGKNLVGGEVVLLISELGGGKTTFVHGLAKGVGSLDRVASPTFTISRVYNGEKLDIYHFDFYRLNDPGIIKHELVDIAGNPKNVVVIEWPEIIADTLPEEYLTIKISVVSENVRNILFTYPKSLSYLVNGYADIGDKN